MICQEAREELAVSILSRREPPAMVEQHIRLCSGCAAEQARLLPMAYLLSAVDPQLVAAGNSAETESATAMGTGPPRRLLDEAAKRRSHRTRRLAAWAAVAAGAVILAGTGWLRLPNDGPTPDNVIAPPGNSVNQPDSRLAFSARSATGVTTKVIADPTAQGSALTLSVSGIKPDTVCVLKVQTRDGQVINVSRWRADYEGEAKVHAVVHVRPDQIAAVRLHNARDRVLVSVPFEPSKAP